MRYRSHTDGIEWKELPNYGLKKCGTENIFESSVRIFHPHMIEIGSDNYFGHGVMLYGYPYNGGVSIQIGSGCWIGQNAYLNGAGGLRIGDRVGIGPGVLFLTSYHDESLGNERVMDNAIAFKGTWVEDGCDIEAGACIGAGVRIGKGSIVRMGAIVVENIPPMSIVQSPKASISRQRSKTQKEIWKF